MLGLIPVNNILAYDKPKVLIILENSSVKIYYLHKQRLYYRVYQRKNLLKPSLQVSLRL